MDHPVPCVRIIIADAQGRVLLLKRDAAEYGQGKWCLPGGKVDYGETVEQAVRKEVFEETALDCTSTAFQFYQDSLPLEEGKMHVVNLYFECTVDGEIQLNEESSEFAWVTEANLDEYSVVFQNDEGLRLYWARHQRR